MIFAIGDSEATSFLIAMLEYKHRVTISILTLLPFPSCPQFPVGMKNLFIQL
jgi:hypothetical protein